MREIYFRGKKHKTGKWIIGSLVVDTIPGLEACIRDFGREYHFVDPETVGQYIGRVDKHRWKIFDGDIIKLSWLEEDVRCEEIFCVRYDEESAGFVKEYDKSEIRAYERAMFEQEALDEYNAEIIGNVWDNPELGFDKTKGAGVR